MAHQEGVTLHLDIGRETAREMATLRQGSCAAPEERPAPAQSFPDMNHREPGSNLPQQVRRSTQTPFALRQQSSRSAFPAAASQEASGAVSAAQSQWRAQDLHSRIERSRVARQRQARAARAYVKNHPIAAYLAALTRCQKPRWSRMKATWLVALCLMRGESPETVRPCSEFVMCLHSLRNWGRI